MQSKVLLMVRIGAALAVGLSLVNGQVVGQPRSLQYNHASVSLHTRFSNMLEIVQGQVTCPSGGYYDVEEYLHESYDPPSNPAPTTRAESWAASLQRSYGCGNCENHNEGFPLSHSTAGNTVNALAVSAGAFAISFSASTAGGHTGGQAQDCCGEPSGGPPGGPMNLTDATFAASTELRNVIVPRAGTISVIRAYAVNSWSNCETGHTSLFVNGDFDGFNVGSAFYTTSCTTLNYGGPMQVPIAAGVYDFTAGLEARHFLNANDAGCTAPYSGSTVGEGRLFVYLRYTPSDVCEGDVNGDGRVDGDDMDSLLYCYGSFVENNPGCGDADLDGDGDIDQDDLDAVIFNFGNDCN